MSGRSRRRADHMRRRCCHLLCSPHEAERIRVSNLLLTTFTTTTITGVVVGRGIAHNNPRTSHSKPCRSQMQLRKVQATIAADHTHFDLAPRVNLQLIRCTNAVEGAIPCRKSCTMNVRQAQAGKIRAASCNACRRRFPHTTRSLT